MTSSTELEQQIAVPIPIRQVQAGVRILAPTGEIGFVPEEQLEEALAAGAKLLTPDLMRQLRQEIFMEHGLFKEQHEYKKPRKRRSIIRSSRMRRHR